CERSARATDRLARSACRLVGTGCRRAGALDAAAPGLPGRDRNGSEDALVAPGARPVAPRVAGCGVHGPPVPALLRDPRLAPRPPAEPRPRSRPRRVDAGDLPGAGHLRIGARPHARGTAA